MAAYQSRFAIQNLSLRYRNRKDGLFTIRNVSLELASGTITGLAGESGCGKSTTALASIGFVGEEAEVTGNALLDGVDLLQLDKNQRRFIWGNKISYVAQSASLALNPAMTIGRQFTQAMDRHLKMTEAEMQAKQLDLLTMMDVPAPSTALRKYPFQFSGGQLQRVALAMALGCGPDVLMLDEPTTGLDVTTQARISALLRRVVSEAGVAILYVSHDLGLLANLSDRLAVMYGGQIVEQGETDNVVRKPKHPYTKLLLKLSPRLRDRKLVPGIPGVPPHGVIEGQCSFASRCPYAKDVCVQGSVPIFDEGSGHEVRCTRFREVAKLDPTTIAFPSRQVNSRQPLLVLDQLELTYPGAKVASVSSVSLKVGPGECVGIVGESGSGKSSVLKMIAGLYAPTDGYMRFENDKLTEVLAKRDRQLCKDIQLVFQNPDASLNPRHTIGYILARSLILFRPELSRKDRDGEVANILRKVGLPTETVSRFPMELSGGQRQRIAVARAFLAQPKLLLCDEVTSALDVSVQATILKMISDLSSESGTAVLMVSHDLALVRTFADKVVVMRQGEVVEQNMTEQLFSSPSHQYTRDLIAAISELPEV